MALPTILDTMRHREIWAPWFIKDAASWEPWRAFLAALFGLPLSEEGQALFRACTGRASPPQGGLSEAWLVVGRRGGKSFVLALIACYLAIFRNWKPYLTPGEIGTIKVVATDRRQARVIHRYCRALLTKVPSLAAYVERDTGDELVLTNDITIEIQTASFRTARGYTVIAALCDEIAYWRSDETSANPDSEIINAIRPAMATIPGAMLLCASSPYARRGELWSHFRRYHGKDDAPCLVWHADTKTMHPSLPQRVLDEAYERDPQAAAAEYGAQFRTDIADFVDRAVVEAAIEPDCFERLYVSDHSYIGFVDPSGGSADSMTLAIAHTEGDRGVLDCIRECKPPFSPEAVVAEFCDVLASYRVHRIMGDRYAGEWPREQFQKRGVVYEPAEKSKSDLYREMLPLLNSRRVDLLDHGKLVSQLCSLERRTGRGTGRDVVDHAPGGHDDVANAVAGVLVAAAVDPLQIWYRLYDRLCT
jgi:hypothetical protein